MTLVVDASAVTELLLRRPAAAGIERTIVAHEADAHAPGLLDIEVVSAVRRLEASRDATPTRAAEAVEDLLDLPIERYPTDILVPRIWELRKNFSVYDAAYVALAEALGPDVQLLTADRRLARAVAKHTDVEPVAS